MLDNDSTTTTSDTFTTPAAPPKRVRVSALAKELGIPSKQLLALLADLGEGAKTASSTLDQQQADRARTAHAAAAEDSTAAVVDSVASVESVATDPAEALPVSAPPTEIAPADATLPPSPPPVLFVAPETTAVAAPRRRRAAKAPAGPPPAADAPAAEGPDITVAEDVEDRTAEPEDVREAAEEQATGAARRRRRRGRRGRGGGQSGGDTAESGESTESDTATADDTDEDQAEEPTEAPPKSGRSRGGRGRGRGGAKVAAEPDTAETSAETAAGESAEEESGTAEGEAEESTTGTRRRRRRRRSGNGSGDGSGDTDDPPNTVVHVREAREAREGKNGRADDDGVKGVKGSTRLEARRQRRRDGRETNRRRPPILTEAEFLARREAVDRVMAVRQSGDRTQIAVLEDDVLVEHYVTRASATSYVGNVYLGRVQNVLPSMEAAFIDIGKGRNGVLYAGEVNWDAAGLEGKSRAIEQALKSGDTVLVQVTKDPIGHKGARLTSQVSLPGRFLVYVPGGGMTGISRRLPDTERHRLKAILKKIVPEDAGVIVRTAAEGASEEDLTRDVERLQAQWAAIEKKAAKTSAAPTLVHGEPDLAIRVVRDVFNEDFKKLVVQGDGAWSTVSEYLEGVAPDLAERTTRHTGDSDLFHDLRVDEQIMKALDRKVWLPSGGSLVIDRTEAMTVIDVNTGKFVGSGGNLEQTVTRNNLEAAEEIVRQLRLRDVGGIVVIDFIDMVLESNRELVLRRLTECLGRDRTKHQVAEVTSLGLVQMTRKRVGEGLLEAFSDTCEVCHGRGIIVHSEPVERSGASNHAQADDDGGEGKKSSRRRRGKRTDEVEESAEVSAALSAEQRNKALAAMNAIHRAAHPDDEDGVQAVAELELDAVAAVLSGSEVDADRLAAEVIESTEGPAASEADAGAPPMVDGAAPVEEPVETVAEPAEPGAEAAEPVDASAEEPAAEPAAVPAAEPAEASAGTSEGPANEAFAESAESEVAAHVVTAPARPRRRRAASRPAGPPTAG